jgi:hypothetical protein
MAMPIVRRMLAQRARALQARMKVKKTIQNSGMTVAVRTVASYHLAAERKWGDAG